MLSLNYKKAMHVWRHYVDFWNFPGRTICNSTLLYSMTADILIPECWPQMSSSWYQLIHNRSEKTIALYWLFIDHRSVTVKIEGILTTSGTSRSIESFSKSKFTSSTALTDSQLHTCIIIFFYFLQIYTELCYSALYMYLYIKKNGFHYVLREGTFSVFH